MMDDNIIDKFKDSFKEESGENITDIENGLLNIGDDSDMEVKNSIFRNFHTIKGSAGMFGFSFTASVVHELETALEDVKQGKLNFNQRIIDSTLMTVDFIRELIEGDESIEKADFEEREKSLVDEVNKAVLGEGSITNTVDALEGSPPIAEVTAQLDNFGDPDVQEIANVNLSDYEEDNLQANLNTYRIIFNPSRGMLFHGHKPINLLTKLLSLGRGEIKIRIDGIPNLKNIDADHLYIKWEIKLVTEEPRLSIEDIFLFLDDQSKVLIEEVVSDYELSTVDYSIGMDDSLLVDDMEQSDLKDYNGDPNDLKTQQVGELERSVKLVSSKVEDQDKLLVRVNVHEDIAAKSKVNIASIKVDARKLDHLVNLVGELVTIQSKLSKEAERENSNILSSISAEFSLLINELRDYTTGLRTIPLEILFIKFQRVIKDLSSQLGKSIAYETHGGDTVLDKSIIERLNEPLVHLIRNSIDHGIETIEDRKLKGKNPQGVIKLSAQQSGDRVIVTIEDDGNGLDRDKILQKAIEKGLVSDMVSSNFSDKEVYDLIFESGFSTAEKVTNISGRGVGMDVVRKQVESLRGSVLIESQLGKYTRTKLIFPLTLAIIEGWLVKVKDEHFIVPLSLVESCLEADSVNSQLDGMSNKKNVMNYRGSLISYIRLRQFFGIDSELGAQEHVVVLNTSAGKLGVIVDEIIGQHQTVVKTLGKIYTKVEGISGATILGDGSLALVIDVDSIIKFIR